MKNYKSFNQWMGEQGFNALRHANCCRIAYEGGQQSMQAKIESITEEFAETEQFLKEQMAGRNIKISNLEYLVEQDKQHIQSQQKRITDLQIRIDIALALIDTSSYAEMQRRLPDFMDQLKEALRGDHAT